MNRNKVTELLKNYRSYKYAIRMFESTGWVAISGTQWSDMPRSGSFGPRAPVKFTAESVRDVMDYEEYRRIIALVDGAMETLKDEEQSVVKLKWMDDMTLAEIAVRKGYSERTIKRTHKMALQKLSICLRFTDIPEIERINQPVA